MFEQTHARVRVMAVPRIRSEESGAALESGSMVAQPHRDCKYSVLAICCYQHIAHDGLIEVVRHPNGPGCSVVDVVAIERLYSLNLIARSQIQPRASA